MARSKSQDRDNGRMGLILRIILRSAGFILAIALLVLAGNKAWHLGYSIFDLSPMESAPGKDVVVTIQEDMSAAGIGKLLAEKGLIRDSLIFRVQSIVYEYDPQPGSYLVNTSETLDEIMEIMSDTSNQTRKTGNSGEESEETMAEEDTSSEE